MERTKHNPPKTELVPRILQSVELNPLPLGIPSKEANKVLDEALDRLKQIEKKARIFAIDPATHCGWAISRTVYGCWDLTPKRDESAGMRLIRLRSKLQEIIKSEKINLVVFERPGGRFKGAIIVQSELQGQIKVVCEDLSIDYRAYSSMEMKKYATGKGNAGKPAMIAAAKTKLGYPKDQNNDNECDALWLLELAKSEYK